MNSDELFTIPAQDSPRLAWLKKHEVTTMRHEGVQSGDEDEFGNELYPWTAWQNFQQIGQLIAGDMGYGATEDEAIARLAINRGLRLWNEEGL